MMNDLKELGRPLLPYFIIAVILRATVIYSAGRLPERHDIFVVATQMVMIHLIIFIYKKDNN